MLEPGDVGGVLPLLFIVSGYAAMERGSEFIETRDLVKAIYIADLEHVQVFWDDWEGFERVVTSERLANDVTETYINRTVYLVRLELMAKDNSGSFIGLGRPSIPFRETVAAARKLASGRVGSGSPTSRDLLFCACSQDPELSETLQESGLQLGKLAAAVRNTAA